MTSHCITASLALLATLVTSSAVAQTRFCIGGDLDHMNAAEMNTCRAEVEAVKAMTASLHTPANWHFVVVCGTNGWKQYAAYTQGDAAALADAVVDTNLEQHETFLRGDRIDVHQLPALRRYMNHEVASMILNSKDEAAIQRQMAMWSEAGTAAAGF